MTELSPSPNLAIDFIHLKDKILIEKHKNRAHMECKMKLENKLINYKKNRGAHYEQRWLPSLT